MVIEIVVGVGVAVGRVGGVGMVIG